MSSGSVSSVSNRTVTHTGHPFGPEGDKTIAYGRFLRLGRRLPAAVFVPTGYGELLFGVWKGFCELRQLGIVDNAPFMVACEPAVRAPLARAIAAGQPALIVEPTPTDTYAVAVAVSVGGYRGVVVICESEGWTEAPDDPVLRQAQGALAREGLWQELSGAIGVAGLREAVAAGRRFDGPVVCIGTPSGFKDTGVGRDTLPTVAPEWATVVATVRREYGIGG